MEKASARRRSLERPVLLLLLALLGLWLVPELAGRREIYPAVVMPSFGTIPVSATASTLPVVTVIVSSGEIESEHPLESLMSGIPDSQWSNVVEGIFAAPGAHDVGTWLFDRSDGLADGCVESVRLRIERAADFDEVLVQRSCG